MVRCFFPRRARISILICGLPTLLSEGMAVLPFHNGRIDASLVRYPILLLHNLRVSKGSSLQPA